MSNESPTFDPNNLPGEAMRHLEAEDDFRFLQEGKSPDRIAADRSFVAESVRKSQVLIRPYLERYGVDYLSQLPIEVQIEIAEKTRQIREDEENHE